MDTVDVLVEQHVKEAELRLRHIDELRGRVQPAAAHEAPTGPLHELLERVEVDRATLARALESLQRKPPADRVAAVQAGQGIRTALEALGTELEKVLTAIGDRRGL